MELVMWSAARRLAVLVFGALAVLGASVAWDRRMGAFSFTLAAVALVLLAVSLVPLFRASRSLRSMKLEPRAHPTATVYRASAGPENLHDDGPERAATRQAVVAFLLLAFAGCLAVVAAAAR